MSQATFYEDQVRNGTWQSPRRMLVVPRGYPDDCAFWDDRSTVDVVLCTDATATNYDHIPSPRTEFRPRDDHIDLWTYPEGR